MIKAFKKDDFLLKEIKSHAAKDDSLRIWWLGQSGFLVQWQEHHVLFDPYLSDSLTRKYADTDKPHVRMSELVIDPAKLDFIDLITSSHNHTDHLDSDTLKPIFEANPGSKFIIPEANRDFVVDRLGCAPDFPLGLSEYQSVALTDEIKITALASAHNELTTDTHGNHKFLGFILSIGPYTLYHSGDTLWYEGLEKKVAQYSPDLLFLPINGNKPERKVAGNMSATEAAQFAKEVGSALVIPHHFHMFEFNTEEPMNFRDEAIKHGINFEILAPGQLYTLKK